MHMWLFIICFCLCFYNLKKMGLEITIDNATMHRRIFTKFGGIITWEGISRL